MLDCAVLRLAAFMNPNLYREIVEKSKVELRPAGQAQLRQLMELHPGGSDSILPRG